MSKKITFVLYENNNERDEGKVFLSKGVTLQQVLMKTIFDNHTKLDCIKKR